MAALVTGSPQFHRRLGNRRENQTCFYKKLSEDSGRNRPARRGRRSEHGGAARGPELLRVAAPDRYSTSDLIDLDGFYGVHPSLAPFQSVYDAGRLAIIEAVGSRWLNRAIGGSKTSSRVRAVAIGSTLPRTPRGPNSAVAVRSPTTSEFGRRARENSNRGTDHGHSNVIPWSAVQSQAERSMANGRGSSASSWTRGGT